MEANVESNASNVQSMRVIFVVMALAGGLMALMGALMAFFNAQLWPALIIAILAVVFFAWGGAGKGVKMVLAIVCLVLGLWLFLNVVLGLVMPPTPPLNLADVLAGDLSGLVRMVKLPVVLGLGAAGGLVALVGSIFGIIAASKE